MEKSDHTESVFKGLSISSGKVCAPVCLYSAVRNQAISDRRIEDEAGVVHELERLHKAIADCSAQLDEVVRNVTATVGTVEAEIFTAQKHILNDRAIVDAIEHKVRVERLNLERSIDTIYRDYEERFSRLDDEYLRERTSDISEIRLRLIDNLHDSRPEFVCKGQHHCSRGRNRVIVARELTADMMSRMNLESVLGIVTEHGGVSSHAAIIARSVGVPAVSGIHGIFDLVSCGSLALVDGDDGTVYLNPDDETITRLIPVDPVSSETQCLLATPAGMLALANASRTEDARMAASVMADGIGLFRTEIFFMQQGRLVSCGEQLDYYNQIQGIMGSRPVTFRLLDIGGDKELPFLRIRKEANPYLGWRGARFLLGSDEILITQLRALVRMSRQGEVRIMVPMVIDVHQMQRLLTIIREVIVTESGLAENVRVGAMFEVPSACLQADLIMREVDFASIGSNDLIQYLFAVDRNNELVSDDYNPDHPVLWSVLESLSRSAQTHNKPLTICGEMAGRSSMVARLLRIGITALSVSPRLIPRIRNEMSEFSTGNMP